MRIGRNNSTGNENKRVAKVVLLGDVAAGKTSFLYRFMKEEFSEFMLPTIGGSFFTHTLYVKEAKADVQFDIWDTAGQELYRSLAPLYYHNADAAIVLYDITDVKSLEGAKRWIEELEEEARPKPFIILVGNKSDLESRRSVPAQLQAESLSVPAFMEASAKTGHNVREIFYRVAEELHGNQSKYSIQDLVTFDSHWYVEFGEADRPADP